MALKLEIPVRGKPLHLNASIDLIFSVHNLLFISHKGAALSPGSAVPQSSMPWFLAVPTCLAQNPA